MYNNVVSLLTGFPKVDEKETQNKVFKTFLSCVESLFKAKNNNDEFNSVFFQERKSFVNFLDLVVVKFFQKEIQKFRDYFDQAVKSFKDSLIDYAELLFNKFEELRRSFNKEQLENIFKTYVEILNKEKKLLNEKNVFKLEAQFSKIKENIKEYLEEFFESKKEERNVLSANLFIKRIGYFYDNFYNDKLKITILKKKNKDYFNQVVSSIQKFDKSLKKNDLNEILIITDKYTKSDLQSIIKILDYANLINLPSVENMNEIILKLVGGKENKSFHKKLNKTQYVHFVNRNILTSLSKCDPCDSEFHDLRVYHLQNSINRFIVDSLSKLLIGLNLNPNIMKLYLEEETILKETELKENILHSRIVKISRTPAYGVKKIIINPCSQRDLFLSLKPTQIFLLILSKAFADVILSSKKKLSLINKELADLLSFLKFDEEFYKQNYEFLIGEFYIIDKQLNKLVEDNNTDILFDKCNDVIENEIILRKLNKNEVKFFISTSFNVKYNDLSILDIFSEYLFSNTNNFMKNIKILSNCFTESIDGDFNVISLIYISLVKNLNPSKQLKSKRVKSFDILFSEIKRNPIMLIANKIESESKWLKHFFSEKDKEIKITKIFVMENLIRTLLKSATISDFVSTLNEIKSEYLKMLDSKEKTLLKMRDTLFKIKSGLKENDNDLKSKEEVTNYFQILIDSIFNKNIGIMKFVIKELQDLLCKTSKERINGTNKSEDTLNLRKNTEAFNQSRQANNNSFIQREEHSISKINSQEKLIKKSQIIIDYSKRPRSSLPTRNRIKSLQNESYTTSSKQKVVSQNYYVTNINIINPGKIVKVQLPTNLKLNINNIPDINMFNKNNKQSSSKKCANLKMYLKVDNKPRLFSGKK